MSTIREVPPQTSEEKREFVRRMLEERVARSRAECPLSHGQRALWFLHQFDPDSAAYNLPFAVRVRTAIDLPALQRALQIVTDRHSALRTRFPERAGQPIQVIQPVRPIDVTTIDARQWSEERLYQEVSAAAYRPFDLAQGPLFRGTIFTRAEQDHVLLFVAHHIIADFWSLVVLMSEIRQVYRPGGNGDGYHLPPLRVQYADYVRWQEGVLAGAEGQQQWDYWSKQLSGELPLLNLPTDRPYPEIQTDRGGAVNFQIDDALADGVHGLAREQGTTPFMLLLAAYQVLLHRYSRQNDILVGSPVASRGKAGFEQLVGYLTNMVVFRSDLGGNPTFSQFLQQVRKTVLDGMHHADYPFSLLVERLQPIRDPSRPPIYQAAFLMEKSHRAEERGAAAMMMGQADARLELGGFTMEPFGLRAAATPFELSLIIEQAGPHLAGCLQYNADLFEPATIERLGASYRHLLAAAVADPRQPIGQIPIMPEAERIRLLADWNATEAAYPQHLCCHELLEAQARQTPNATAVVFADQQLTYAELHQRSNQLAHYLRHLGVGPDTPVGICTERSLDMVVGLLGILKAGGAYLPLDPAFPRDRLAFMLEDSGAALLLTQQQLVGDLPPYHGRVVCLDRDWEQIARHPDDTPAPAAKPEHLAYVIYTSGSTGRPKGVQIPHRALVNFLCSMAHEPGLDRSDVLLSVTTLSFDIFALELYLPLLVGARVVLADRAAAADPVRLQKLLVQSHATVMQATPATWHMLLQANWPGDPCLRILVGGEALASELANQLLDRGRCLWNLYGPTETTVWSTLCQIQREYDEISIGRPLANTQVYLLDEHLEPVPVGVPGELYLGGAGVARGYLRRPGLTAERFLPDPFRPAAGARMYRTGDLARWLPDGRIECLGRMDHQVKVRGFRIELGEIETALVTHPAIRQSVVVARPDQTRQNRLIAYVVTEAGQLVPADVLRNHLRDRLPEYMLPVAFVTLDALPLTPNGKIDRQALPTPDASRPELHAAAYVAPRTPTEDLLAAIWSEVLEVERVGIHDNFFELGGHSLLAAQIVSRVREQFGRDLPLRKLFEEPTIANLAALIEHRDGPPECALATIERVDRDGELPLSFGQERLWFLDHLSPRSPLYSIPAAVRVSGRLDVPVLRASLNEIVQRHEALRACFETVKGQPVQRIVPALDLDLPVIDLTGLAEKEQAARVDLLASDQARRPFSLSSPPLLRTSILRLSETEHVFLLTMHHIVSDGWSMGVFLGELASLYEAFSQGRPSPLPALALQYPDYAAWQRRHIGRISPSASRFLLRLEAADAF